MTTTRSGPNYWIGPAPINGTGGQPVVGSEEALNRVFNWFNSNGGTNRAPFFVSVPGTGTQIRESLDSPSANEYAIGTSRQLGQRGAVRVDAVLRDFKNFYSQRVDTATGQVTNEIGDEFDLNLVENSNEIERSHDGSTGLASQRSIAGAWTCCYSPRRNPTFHRIRPFAVSAGLPLLGSRMTVHTSRPRVSWSLNAESFEHLLRGLGRDREAAAIEYERLRHRLTAFFDWRGLADAEAAVDETFDRVARRLLEGEPIQHVAGYAYGVARLVAQETRRREHRQSERIESLGCHSGPAERITSLDHQRGQDDEPALERRQTCLDRCLETIPPRRRELILEYYRHDGSVGRTGQHRTQAAGLQLSAAALRVAAYRIRMVLERCVEQCMAEQDP